MRTRAWIGAATLAFVLAFAGCFHRHHPHHGHHQHGHHGHGPDHHPGKGHHKGHGHGHH